MKNRYIILFGLITTFTLGCKEDDPVFNLPPDTHISVSEINREGDRLISRVRLSWYGTDKDGYVTGYELSVNDQAYVPVKTQDSTFVFDIAAGADSTDVHFRVRAVDNEGAIDPTPAYLLIPVKNTPPVSSFSQELFVPDTVRIVPTFGFAFDDVDGAETVDSLFLKFNNGDWFGFTSRALSATVLPINPSASGSVSGKVYLDEKEIPLAGQINGVNLDGANQVFYRAKDVANAYSEIDTVNIFIKKKSNDLLVLDSYASSASTVPNPEQIYFSALAANNISFDYDNLLQDYTAIDGYPYLGGMQRLGFKLLVRQYEKLFWYSDLQKYIGRRIDNSGGRHLLEQASDALQDFLNNQGKIFIASSFKDIPNTSSLYQYTPATGFPANLTPIRIFPGYKAYPGPKFINNFDTLTFQGTQLGASPFFMKPTADILYTSDFSSGGRQIVAATTEISPGRTNMVFWSIELFKYSADQQAFNDMMGQVFLNEFNW